MMRLLFFSSVLLFFFLSACSEEKDDLNSLKNNNKSFHYQYVQLWEKYKNKEDKDVRDSLTTYLKAKLDSILQNGVIYGNLYDSMETVVDKNEKLSNYLSFAQTIKQGLVLRNKSIEYQHLQLDSCEIYIGELNEIKETLGEPYKGIWEEPLARYSNAWQDIVRWQKLNENLRTADPDMREHLLNSTLNVLHTQYYKDKVNALK